MIARPVARAPNARVQSRGLEIPKVCLARASAESRMAMISNAPQPVSCTAFSTAGMAAPRVPRAGLSEPMAERPVSAPTTPAAASSSTPSTEPVTIAASAAPRLRPGTRKAPACSTSRPMPRLNHSEKASKTPKTRRSPGTGVRGS